jgi:hypothetical protein
VSEHDLGLKVGVRSLLWSMGYSTRLDVVLRGHDRPTAGGAPESFTDLDVLGVRVAPGYRLSTAIADCKSGKQDKPTARMFWARGVADLFGADDVMVVREHEVNDATRQLSSRLGITVLTAPDLVRMQELHGPALEDPGPLGILFDRTSVAANFKAFTGLDKRLNPLIEYREFDYWVYDQHRNPVQLVAHLRDAAKRLTAENPVHLALFFDLAWLYLLSMVRITEHLRGAFLQNLDRGLQEYLFGGAIELKEKQETAELLQRLKPDGAREMTHLPEYYTDLRELVTRLLRRPHALQAALRYAEAASALSAARTRVTLKDAWGDRFDAVAAKLVADVCGFLVAAADLDPAFRAQARAYLLAEPVSVSAPPAAPAGAGATAPPTAAQPASTADGPLDQP